MNKKTIEYLTVILILILGGISLFGYYSMYTMFKTYGRIHLLKTITTAISLGVFLSAYFFIRQLFKLPTKISLLKKIKIIFLVVIIGCGYLAFKPIQMITFMIISFALPVIAIVYLFNDAVWFIRKNKKEF